MTEWLSEGSRGLVAVLLLLMMLDVLSGLLAAFVTRTLSSSVSWRGAARKLLTLVMVAVGYLLEAALDLPTGRMGTIAFVITESLSILENASRAGVAVPSVLSSSLAARKGSGGGGSGAAPSAPDPVRRVG